MADQIPAFVVSISLWATFILLDEVLLIFETGAEATHLRLLIAELLSLCLLRPGGLLILGGSLALRIEEPRLIVGIVVDLVRRRGRS